MKKKVLPFLLMFLFSCLLAACSFQSVDEFEKQEAQEQSVAEQKETEIKEEVNSLDEIQQESEQQKETEAIKANEEEQQADTKTQVEPETKKTEPVEQKEVTSKKEEFVLDLNPTVSEKKSESTKPDSTTSKKTPEQPQLNKKPSENTAAPVAPVTPVMEVAKRYVTIAIRVDTLLKHWDLLDPALQSEKYVPKNGVILKTTKYELLNDKETVWDVLVRATKEHKIQMEYQGANENVYKSVYVEGINYLYEFSAGELSGWMYKVNNDYPNYGSSQYVLKDGDVIEWHYTVDLGRDLGEVWVGE